jgi:hypothetical protein
MELKALVFSSKITEIDSDCRNTSLFDLMITIAANWKAFYPLAAK